MHASRQTHTHTRTTTRKQDAASSDLTPAALTKKIKRRPPTTNSSSSCPVLRAGHSISVSGVTCTRVHYRERCSGSMPERHAHTDTTDERQQQHISASYAHRQLRRRRCDDMIVRASRNARVRAHTAPVCREVDTRIQAKKNIHTK